MRYSVLKAGRASRRTRERIGDFSDMFIDLLSLPGQTWDVHDVEHGEFPERLEDYSGFVITGSMASAYDDDPSVKRLIETTREIHRLGIPLLAVCYGAQVVAQALGGEVTVNPEGWEIGRVPLELTAAGRSLPQLNNVPQPLWILQTHQDIVSRLPQGAQHLAYSARTPHEIFIVGASVLCLQGHPEMDTEVVRDLIEKRAERGLLAENHAVEALASLEQPPHREFLQSWLRTFMRDGRLQDVA